MQSHTIPLGVKGRVSGNQVHSFGVHATKDFQVIHLVEDVIGKVLLSQCDSPYLRWSNCNRIIESCQEILLNPRPTISRTQH